MLGLGLGIPDIAVKGRPAWLLQGATFDLDFAHNRFYSGGVKPISSVLNVSRSTVGYIDDSSGNLTQVLANVLRYSNKGSLVEELRTNILLRSQEFDNAAWSKTDTTVTADATIAPDGTLSADLLTEGTAGTGATAQAANAAVASVPVSASVFLKQSANNTWVEVILTDSAVVTGVQAWLNLATGAVGTVTARGTATSVSAVAVAVANGFWWLKMVATFQSGTTNGQMIIRSASADNSTTRVNNAAYYAWQADIQIGAFATTPFRTTSAAAARAADVVTASLPTGFNPNAGTLYAEASVPQATSSFAAIFGLNDGTGNNRINIFLPTASRFPNGFVNAGGVTQATISVSNAYTYGNTPFRTALAFAANDFAIASGGTLGSTDSSGSIPTVTGFSIGALFGTSNILGGYVRRVAYFPSRLPNATLQALTT